MNRRNFIKRGALFLPMIFTRRLIRAQAFTFRDPTFNCVVPVSGGTWTPSAPANALTEWLKADALSLSDGDHVTTWTASVGNNATGPDSASCVFKTNVQNSKPTVRFSTDCTVGGNTGSYLQTANWGTALSQPYTIFAVFRYNCGAGSGLAFWSGTSHRISFNHIVSGDRFGCYAENGADFAYMGSSDNNFHVMMIEYNGASTKYRFDGGSEQTVASSPGTATWEGLTLGALETFGQAVDADFGEVIIYAGSLSSGDKISAFGYLNTRWAVYS